MWKKILPYLFGFGTATSGSLMVVHQGWLGTGEKKEDVSKSPSNVSEGIDLQEDTLNLEEDGVYRTSEEPNEKSTKYTRSYSPKPPKNGFRVGCICMNGDRQENRGGGACAGSGGVRFWLYQLENGNLLEHPTARHSAHPEPLSEQETKNLVGAGKKKMPVGGGSLIGMYEVLFGLMFCITASYIARLWWKPYGQ